MALQIFVAALKKIFEDYLTSMSHWGSYNLKFMEIHAFKIKTQ